MGLQQIGAVVIIAGVALFVLAMFTAPPGLYEEPDIDRRVAMLAGSPTRWLVSQWLFAFGILVPALGFGLVAAALWNGPGGWAAAAGAALLVAGAVIGAYIVYVQTQDPGAFWRTPAANTRDLALCALNIVGLFLLAVAMWQGPLPNWTAYLTVGYALVFAVGTVVQRGNGMFVVVMGMYGVALVDAIGFLRG